MIIIYDCVIINSINDMIDLEQQRQRNYKITRHPLIIPDPRFMGIMGLNCGHQIAYLESLH